MTTRTPLWRLVVSPGTECDCGAWVREGYLLGMFSDDPVPRAWLCLGCVAARVRETSARQILEGTPL